MGGGQAASGSGRGWQAAGQAAGQAADRSAVGRRWDGGAAGWAHGAPPTCAVSAPVVLTPPLSVDLAVVAALKT
ncbi:hypothetical protein Voc01_016230 [Virgisporangium ochraceum]|uniref:Uncharacterized protein n=1 Tax=Virgisporangium ochraceum TaxID=65505 RepID=A0A8J3ZN47_9ACTN|nr:hypothetical protein Voc01_016230 [Virgisporangium ochraceum]